MSYNLIFKLNCPVYFPRSVNAKLSSNVPFFSSLSLWRVIGIEHTPCTIALVASLSYWDFADISPNFRVYEESSIRKLKRFFLNFGLFIFVDVSVLYLTFCWEDGFFSWTIMKKCAYLVATTFSISHLIRLLLVFLLFYILIL